jgi:CheY-like chemotaxis protein
VIAVGNTRDAMATLAGGPLDCMVVCDDDALLDEIAAQHVFSELPIIVYRTDDLPRREDHGNGELLIKEVRTRERLLHETTLHLHRAEASLPEPQRTLLAELDHAAPELDGATILVVDDDVRNIFAITSVLESHQATVRCAENGKQGLELLERTPGIDVVLMDIMMPELDGYEVMRRIRAQEKWKALPIIALTAKAMRADREKCIEAGASDYIAKPVDMDKLLSLLRVWLER